MFWWLTSLCFNYCLLYLDFKKSYLFLLPFSALTVGSGCGPIWDLVPCNHLGPMTSGWPAPQLLEVSTASNLSKKIRRKLSHVLKKLNLNGSSISNHQSQYHQSIIIKIFIIKAPQKPPQPQPQPQPPCPHPEVVPRPTACLPCAPARRSARSAWWPLGRPWLWWPRWPPRPRDPRGKWAWRNC